MLRNPRTASRAAFCKNHAAFASLLETLDYPFTVMLSKCGKGPLLVTKRCASTAKSPAKMMAWQIYQYGGNEELTLSDRARAATIKAPNELLIKVHAASVNPIDVKMRGGYGQKVLNMLRAQQGGLLGSEFPLILGRDFSGVVIETGRAVYGALSAYRQGSHAQFTVASDSEIAKKPQVLSHTEAASIPYVATTSWAALCTIGELSEKNAHKKRVLVQGGSGGIGTFSIQLLKAWGAYVATTCSTDAVDFLRNLGADAVIDYKTTDAKKELSKLPQFDFVFDAVGGPTADDSFDLLKKWTNAKLVTIVHPFLQNTDSFGVVPGMGRAVIALGSNLMKGFSAGRSYRWAIFLPNGKALEKVGRLVQRDLIHPVVEKEFPFSELPAAFQFVEEGHNRGKTVVKMVERGDQPH
ncbi:hypothetical protein BaRGS_00021021 [Batillaria attramentaria]|uniref:Enoyl reductase (ER) domain-containing protein n=1 Tax=Batillaria attramentaria TaxID=370345 RepID=A0ABD0KKS4_9CAEN